MHRFAALAVLVATGLAPGAAMAHRNPGPVNRLSVVGASDQQIRRLDKAIGRFRSANLSLPPLVVHFHDTPDPCRGRSGLFRDNSTPWEIHICSETPDVVYEHELAHAWARHALTDGQRESFVEMIGLETWNDPAVPWAQRGTEAAAVMIQQGVSGLPLPPALSVRTRRRIEGYRLLTGETSPRYTRWLKEYAGGTALPRS